MILIRPGMIVREVVHDSNRRIAPVHNHAGIRILDQPNMGETTFLVRHMLTAAAPGPHLETLVAHPQVLLRYPAGTVIGPAPIHHANRRLVKLYHDIGIVTRAPKVVPQIMVLQGLVLSPETVGNAHFARKNPLFEVGIVAKFCIGFKTVIRFADIPRRQGLVIYPYLIDQPFNTEYPRLTTLDRPTNLFGYMMRRLARHIVQAHNDIKR